MSSHYIQRTLVYAKPSSSFFARDKSTNECELCELRARNECRNAPGEFMRVRQEVRRRELIFIKDDDERTT